MEDGGGGRTVRIPQTHGQEEKTRGGKHRTLANNLASLSPRFDGKKHIVFLFFFSLSLWQMVSYAQKFDEFPCCINLQFFQPSYGKPLTA